MSSIQALRRATAFDPHFLARSPLFWPLARAALPFAGLTDWPAVESYERAFAGDPPVRFAPAAPRSRRRRQTLDPGALYDARIVEGRIVPSRPRSWHDFMNALVWATFPCAKFALHLRQHRAIRSRLPPSARKLPPVRTRELDTLAMLDEGGVVKLASPQGEHLILFGHALYEGLVLGAAPATARVAAFQVEELGADCLEVADRALAGALLEGSFCQHPGELPRLDLETENDTGIHGR